MLASQQCSVVYSVGLPASRLLYRVASTLRGTQSVRPAHIIASLVDVADGLPASQQAASAAYYVLFGVIYNMNRIEFNLPETQHQQ